MGLESVPRIRERNISGLTKCVFVDWKNQEIILPLVNPKTTNRILVSDSLLPPSQPRTPSNSSDGEATVLCLFDGSIAEKKACFDQGSPICLDNALEAIFGERGKEVVERIAREGGAKSIQAASIEDIWKMYEDHMIALGKKLGDDVARVISHESVKQMELMLCTRCPIYKFEKLSRESTIRSHRDSESNDSL